MAFITERTRLRAVPRASAPKPAEPLRWPAFAGLALRRRLTAGGPWIATVAAVAALLAGLSLARPADRSLSPEAAYLDSQLVQAGSVPQTPRLPDGLAVQPADQRPAPLLTAALAADLWQANNAVYQAEARAAAGVGSPTPTVSATPQATATAGPSLDELLRAQARLATAQLVYQALQQSATDAQLATARSAVAQAQAQIDAARQLVQASLATASPTATPEPTVAPPSEADLAAAQQAVQTAQAAYTRALHPHSDEEIAAARSEVTDAQAALAAARAAAAPPRPVTTSAPPAATPPPAPTSAPAPSPAATSAPALPGGFSGASVTLTDPNTGASGAAGAGGAVVGAGPGLAAPIAAGSGGASALAPSALPIASATAVAVTPPPTVIATPPPAAPTAAPARPTVAAPSGAVFLAQQRVEQAQRQLALVTAAPNPGDVQAALDALAARAIATPIAIAAPAGTPVAAPTVSPSQQLAQAQDAYSGAVQQLQALAATPDPATLSAARDEYTAAQQALQSLMASADPGVAAQVNADPQQALLHYNSSPATGLSDIRPFIWPAHGPVSSLFGPAHPLGIDIAQGLGLPVTAAASGVVTFSGGDPCCGYGYYVDITHPGGYLTRYGHLLTRSFLQPGDRVNQGQLIGVSGTTGFSTGPHVHFEIRLNGVPQDPLKLIAGLLPRPLAP